MTAEQRRSMCVQTLTDLLDDLRAEGDFLDEIVATLPHAHWQQPTPAAPWTIAHQIAHLAWADERAVLSATDPERFVAQSAGDSLERLMAEVERAAHDGAALPPAELMDQWRTHRTDLLRALAQVAPGTRLPWAGPSMSVAAMASARLMETFAHGQDVLDALGHHRILHPRHRHVADIGIRARPYAYRTNGLDLPASELRVELTGPGDDRWVWGPETSDERISGDALEFCLVVTQRRHLDDTSLTSRGNDAAQWLVIAQAYAGPPGPGRPPSAADQKVP